MNSKTYRATTMAQALAEVKRELGRDAVILRTRSFRKGGLFGIGGRDMWEIIASAGGEAGQVVHGRYVADAPAVPSEPATARPRIATPAIQQASVPESVLTEPTKELGEIRRMVEALLAMRERQPSTPQLNDKLLPLRQRLIEQDVEQGIVDELLGQLGQQVDVEACDANVLKGRLRELIASRIVVANDPPPTGRAQVAALVGPTGVGKTTTIAKLAANFKLRHNRSVGLVTIDTYRIAAVDQLRTYADIIDIPLKVVLSAAELHEAVAAMSDLDVVLVDTAGRSHNDRLRVNQLRSFINAMQADQVHLVVSAAASSRSIRASIERFGPLGVNRVIMTKLDESETFGSILNVAVAAGTPLSYVTTGQDVPDDMAAADARSLADLILEDQLP